MKKDIHPKYYEDCKVFVGGVLVATTGSTKPEIHLEVWSGTHPYYTGEHRLIDTEGQVDRFTKRLGRKADELTDKAAKSAKRRAKRQIAEIIDEGTTETEAVPTAE